MEGVLWWSDGCSQLKKIPELSYALELLQNYVPADDLQLSEQRKILEFCRVHPDALFRSCTAGHLTASAIVVNSSRTEVLLHHHAKLDLWLQFGGHCDGDGNLPHVAWREAVEESGISLLRIDPTIIDVDIHKIPAWKSEAEHLHLDVRFIIEAPDGSAPQISDESLSAGWFSLPELSGVKFDESVIRLAELALD